MIKKVNLGVVAVAILLITGFAQQAEAFPLPSMDIKKLMDNAKIVMSQVQEIKAEVESNMHIIKEIQNGGFGAAVNDLYGKIENGDYDRFGNRLKTIKQASQDSLDEVQDGRTRSKAEKEARKKGMSKEEAKKYADEKVAEQQAKREEERMLQAQAKAEAKANRQKTGIQKAYNWLKDNRSVTDTVRKSTTAALKGDWGGVASSALSGVGTTMSNVNQGKMENCAAGDKECEARNKARQDRSNAGNLMAGLAGNAGNSLNSALKGDWGGVTNSALSGLGTTMSNANQGKMENCAAGDKDCEARNKARQDRSNAGNLMAGLAGNAGNIVNSATSGDWGGVTNSALSGVGGAIANANQNKMESCAAGDKECEARNKARQDKSNAGNLISGLAGNAGNMVNSATSGNWGGVTNSALSGVGGAIANANQNKMESCAAGDKDCEARNQARQNKTNTGNMLTGIAGNAGSTINSALGGNWGAAIGSAGQGVATGLTSGGNAQAGDIVSKASAGAAGAVNAAQSGNWGKAISEAGAGTGGALQAGGLQKAGDLVGSAGNTVGMTVGKVQEGGSLVDVGKKIAKDDEIKSEAKNAYNAYKNIRKARQAKKAQAEQKDSDTQSNNATANK